MDESTFTFRDSGSEFSFLFHFSMKFMSANRIAPDETSHLGLFCLPMFHNKDARIIWVNICLFIRLAHFHVFYSMLAHQGRGVVSLSKAHHLHCLVLV